MSFGLLLLSFINLYLSCALNNNKVIVICILFAVIPSFCALCCNKDLCCSVLDEGAVGICCEVAECLRDVVSRELFLEGWRFECENDELEGL